MQTYFAPGKVLLSGEYLVTRGFDGLALPVNKGQWLQIWEFNTPNNQTDFLVYQAKDMHGNTWFETKLSLPDLNVMSEEQSDNHPLADILKMANSSRWISGTSYRLETRLEFERSWGLGSSSTFVKLMSDWLQLNPFEVQFKFFGGSGYDIASAILGKPLVYSKINNAPQWKSWQLNPQLTQHWNVVFLGKKANSRDSVNGVSSLLDELKNNEIFSAQWRHLSKMVEQAEELVQLEAGLEMMQLFLSQSIPLKTPYQYLNIKPISKGLCKWLGAWEGDMILANNQLMEHYEEVFYSFMSMPWNELIVNE